VKVAAVVFALPAAHTGLALAARFLAGLAAARRSSWTTRRREGLHVLSADLGGRLGGRLRYM
jgi:hypothetical protein